MNPSATSATRSSRKRSQKSWNGVRPTIRGSAPCPTTGSNREPTVLVMAGGRAVGGASGALLRGDSRPGGDS